MSVFLLLLIILLIPFHLFILILKLQRTSNKQKKVLLLLEKFHLQNLMNFFQSFSSQKTIFEMTVKPGTYRTLGYSEILK